MNIEICRVERPVVQGGNGQVDAKRIVIGTPDMRSISPFLRFSEDWFAAPGGFETHPHRGMQTVTFVLEGALHHRDHTGADGVLRAGDVQWMTAGRGVLHSEMPYKNEIAHTLQLWLNLPARMKMNPARYQDQPGDKVPVRNIGSARARIFAGTSGDIVQPHGSDWPMMLIEVQADDATHLSHEIPAAWRGFVYMLEGAAKLGANYVSVSAPDIAWFDPSAQDGQASISMESERGARMLLIASPPIDENVVAYGPFVMNTNQEIEQAIADYRAGRLTG